MQRLRQMFDGTVKGLSALSGRDKLLIGSLATIAIMVLVLIAGFSARTSMVPLFGGATTAQKVNETKTLLANMGFAYEMRGPVLYVADENKYKILGLLGGEGKLDTEASVLFDTLTNRQHWMNSQRENHQWFMLAKANELAKVISNFKGIKTATVQLDIPENPGLLSNFRKPTASVMVTTAEPMSQARANAISGMVAGACAGLSRADVKVVDATSGVEFKSQAESDLTSSDYLDHVSKVEARLRDKIAGALSYVKGAIVTVNAQVDMRMTKTNTKAILPIIKGQPGSFSTPSKTTTDTTLSGSDKQQGGPPGAQSNVMADIASGGAAGGGKNETNKEDTEYKVETGSKNQETIDTRGNPTKLSVTVSVPQEYIAAMVKAAKGDAGKDAVVTKAELDTAFADEKKRIALEIEPLVETVLSGDDLAGAPKPQPGTVVVSMIPVPYAPAANAFSAGTAQTAGVGGWVENLGGTGIVRQVVLVVLAMMALGMMFLLVRKASKPMELPTAQELVGLPPALDNPSDLVGEADEGETAMEGIELDDNRLRVKKILEQVTEMVKKDPTDAAVLLNRWIVRED